MLTYHKKTVEDITSLDSFETQQNLVFQTYVSRMLQRRGTQKRYTPEQTVYWLQWLAGQLTQRSQTQFTLERMQPDWLNEHLIRWEWYGAILFGLTYFLIGIFLGWLIGNAIFGNLFGYIVGLLCGALGGYFGALYGWRNSEISPAETMKVTKVSLRETIQLPFMRGKDKGYGDFIGAMLAGAFLAQRVGGLLGLLGGLNFAILFEYAIHLLFRVKPRLLEKHLILAPNEGIHRSGRNACICGLFEGILVGIFAGLVFGGVLNGVLIGFLFAVLGWLQFGGQAYVQHYLLRWLLYNAKFTPWTYVHFLDYATERILLRKVGGSYIFIHRQLLEYFARIHISSTNNNTTKT